MHSNIIARKPKESAPPTGIDFFARSAFAGAISCAVTHGTLTPIDVVKTRMQLEPTVYKNGMLGSFRQVVKNEGAGILLTGLGPTVTGYFIQGAFKFGGYEFFKKTIIETVGVETATNNRTAVYLASSAIAEFFADIALCPLEATRIRLVSQPGFATGLISGFSRIFKEEGIARGFYSGFIPILFKQVPYNMTKFVAYERATEAIYASIGKSKEQLSPVTNTYINLGAGLIAGFAAAIISQPADTLLSKINKQKGAEGSIVPRLIIAAKELGPRGLFLGLGARIIMVGALTSGQFAIYGDIKRILGATNSIELAKPQTA